MKFGDAKVLWALLFGGPLLVAFFMWSWRRKETLLRQFVQSRLLASLMVGNTPRRELTRYALLTASFVLLLFSLARPQWGYTLEEAKQHGLDIMVAVDVSRSMLAQDVSPNRLERARLAALDLLRIAKTDRLGLVPFAGSAFLQCPLTLDEEAFRQSVQVLDTDIIEQGGTGIAEAIKVAQTAFKSGAEDNFKVLIILTDGEDHEGEVMPAVEAAAKKGLRIFTVGVGTAEGELLRLPNEQGVPTLVKDDDGNIVRTRLNEKLLQQIATSANGFYLPLRGTSTMETLYERGLAPLPKGELSSRFVRHYHEQFQWPLALAIILLVVELFLPTGEHRRKTRRELVIASTSSPAAIVLVFLLCGVLAANASPGTAEKEFEKGDYDKAREEYQRLLKEKPEDARLQYNAGAAAYRAGDYGAAVRSFGAAQLTDDLQLQGKAYYNQGNSFFKLGEKGSDPEERTDYWEMAARNYEKALKLDPKDADAQHNLEFVRKLLQQQQQEQEQESNQQSKSGKGKGKGKRKSKPDPNGKDGENNDDGSDQNGNSRNQNQRNKPDQQKQDEGKNGDKDKDDQKDGQNQNGKDQKDSGDGKDQDAGNTASKARAMSRDQAEQLLDSQKGEEKPLLFQPPSKGEPRQRNYKNW